MKREEMLFRLKSLSFTVLWPEDWKDIDFTERPIWINSQGYGYYLSDEPCSFTIIDGISDVDIQSLKNQISNGSVSLGEIKNSPFKAINVNDDEYLEYHLIDFLKLPDHTTGRIFCGVDAFDCWNFFSTEEELVIAFDKGKNFCGGKAWEEVNDDILAAWCNRISDINSLRLELPLTNDAL